jgi:hypothetical protein
MRVLAALVALAAAVSDDHPVQRVIALLEDLQVQAKKQGESEALLYQKFDHWCVNVSKDLKRANKKHNEIIAIEEAAVEGLSSAIETLTANIAKLDAEITKREAAKVQADNVRNEGHAAFEAAKADLESTIQALKDAIAGLKESKPTMIERSAVKKAILLSASKMTHKQHQVARAFLQEDPKDQFLGRQGRVREYDFKSGGVIEMLEQLQKDFEADLRETNVAETNAGNAHTLSQEAQDQAIADATKAKTKKETLKAGKESDLALSKENLASERDDLSADTAALDGATQECNTKADEWSQRQKTRSMELEAMVKAVEILGKVTGVRNPETQVIAARAASFLQVVDPRGKVASLLRKAATQSNDKALSKLASLVSAGGHFDKIEQMIQKLIFRLQKEQKDEDEHKHWCDMETEKSEESRDDKQEKVALLQTKIDAAHAERSSLRSTIAENEAEVARITKYMEEETDLRAANHQDNLKTIKDAKDAQAAIANAVAVLTQFYKNSGMMEKQAWEFLQAPVDLPESPSTWDAGYTGVTDPAAQPEGIVTVLEKVASDFATMEGEAAAQDESDQKDFDEDMTENQTLNAELKKDSEMKTARAAELDSTHNALSKQHKATSNELEAVEQYLKDLQPSCHEGDSTYDERKASRAQELGALREAQVILRDAFKAQE